MAISFIASSAQARASFVACAFAALLTACGGGDSAAPPTELPQTLTVSGPSVRSAMGANVELSSNAVDTANALKYQWQFGDGSTSSLSKPSHAYAKPGMYTVLVTVTNESGDKRDAEFVVRVFDLDLVRGKACNQPDGSGWCWQRPLPQGNNISSYHYLDDKRAWAVGDAGTILTTADAGVTWTAQHSGTDLPLTAVSFVDAQIGWAAGSNGEVLRTGDGGNHWAAYSMGANVTVQSLLAFDANSAAATTNYNELYVTQDGGTHWKSVSYQGGTQYTPVSAINIWGALNTWGSPISLVHTTDAGANWTKIDFPSAEPNLYRTVQTLRFIDATHGWLVYYESGYSTVTSNYVYRQVGLRTVDGGATWQPFDADPLGLAPYGYYSVEYQFTDGNTAFARSNYSSSFKRSVDGGATWQSLPGPDTSGSSLSSFRAFSAQVIVGRDYAGRTYTTTDGGAHWTRSDANGSFSYGINSIWLFDSREGLAISGDGSSIRTNDGGQTWTTTTPNSYYGWQRLQFLADGSTGWVISDTGSIYRSTDKGKTWMSPVPQTSAPIYASDFHFIDSLHGWAVSIGYGGNTFFSTTDGGISWQALPGYSGTSGFSALRFADSMHGVAVGPAGVALVTTDAGTTWLARPTGTGQAMRRVTFVDSMVAVAVGEYGAIIRSNDRGQSWFKVPSPTTNRLNDVRFLSATMGYATGDLGTVMITNDGGMSWTLLPTGVNAHLQSAFFTDAQTGWAVGDNGTIIVTTTGGR